MTVMNIKDINRFLPICAVIMSAVWGLVSCVSEAPFETSEGNGNLKINAQVRGDVTVTTRTTTPAEYDQTALENNLVVYIERQGNNAGLVKKYKGKSSIPTNISLTTGNYVVEAWTGDSVSASWDKKFYRAYEPVKIESDVTNELALKCNIANVVVSVKEASLSCGLEDLHVIFWHSRKGSDNQYVLDFGETEISDGSKAYFMMPTVDHKTGEKETELNYKVSGKTSDGNPFEKTGTLDGVLSAHEYQVLVKADQSESSNNGGALIRLEIEDIPLVEETVEVFPAPIYEAKYGQDDFDLEKQLDLTSSAVYDLEVLAVCYGGLGSYSLSFSDNFEESLKNDSGKDLNTTDNSYIVTKFKEKGISYEHGFKTDISFGSDTGVEVDIMTLTLSKSFFESLPESKSEYVITISITDNKGRSSSAKVRFANSEAAIEHPAPVGSVDMSKVANTDYTLITPYSATLLGEVYTEEAQNYGIKYREKGTTEWTEVSALSTKADNYNRFSVKVSELKANTRYEYKAYCDGFEETGTREFTTESVFVIPNASMEDWSSYSASTLLGTKDVVLPWSVGDKDVSFWGSGNEGSATANMTLTEKSTDMIGSGSYSVRLESAAAMGVLAAGNLFVGSYVKTDGTNGVLSVGREYNGSHPAKLKVYANYRPASGVSVKSGNESFVPSGFSGGTDHGQIYVALTTETVEIRTNPSNRKLFDKEGTEVVAYGEVTWTENFGPDGALEFVEIPLEYKSSAKTIKPKYLVIVCSASKYGDYFSGAKGSVMYLDDFELIYE